MKGMHKPFKFQGERLGLEKVVPCANIVVHFQDLVKNSKFEPISVLDNISSPSPPTSTSTVGGPGKWLEKQDDNNKSGDMEDWESVLTESGQEQSILKWIMGDVEDPLMGLNKIGDGQNGNFHEIAAFGAIDQGFLGYDVNNPQGQNGNFHDVLNKFENLVPVSQIKAAPAEGMLSDQQYDVKPPLVNQNLSFVGALGNETLVSHEAKRYNSGGVGYNFQMPQNLPLVAPSSVKRMMGGEEIGIHHQGIIDQLYKAADMIQCGNNPILAQSILARLNHQLSPIGKPFERAAFFVKGALQLLIHSIVNNMNPVSSPFSLILKIGAYKSFSEVSPFVQFTNFTCNQAILENLEGFDRIHIVDFDIGYGDQWASFMQELALRGNNSRIPSLKITAFASPTNNHLELSLTRENLVNFANEMNVGFDFEIVSIDVLASVTWSLPFRVSDNEAIAVNLPISSFSSYRIPFPLILRFVKNLSPKIVVSVDRGCERTDLPFPNHIVHALQSVSNLLESLDAVNMNLDTLQKIERFLIQPSVEKIITGRFSFPEKTQHWKSQFLSCGFTPLTFSNFAESQALCVIKRTPVWGFHIERRQSSLVLCWQHREIVSASAWRC